MGRILIFEHSDIPRGVVAIAVAVISDYDRRTFELSRGDLPERVRDAYIRYQEIVDAALMSIEPGYRAEFIGDIKRGRGWENSYLQKVYSRGAYYRRKRAAICAVAAGLGLVELTGTTCTNDCDRI